MANRFVLIVEHRKPDLALLSRMVERCGLEPVMTSCGEEAVGLFGRRPEAFSLVLLNSQMQGVDGPGTLYRIRKVNETVPICCINGRRPLYSRDELLAMGAIHVFRKPLLEPTIFGVLAQLGLGNSRRTG